MKYTNNLWFCVVLITFTPGDLFFYIITKVSAWTAIKTIKTIYL